MEMIYKLKLRKKRISQNRNRKVKAKNSIYIVKKKEKSTNKYKREKCIKKTKKLNKMYE